VGLLVEEIFIEILGTVVSWAADTWLCLDY